MENKVKKQLKEFVDMTKEHQSDSIDKMKEAGEMQYNFDHMLDEI